MSLAAELASCEAAYLRAERKVEAVLDSLYDRWESFEYDQARVIEVFGVVPSPTAVDTLLRAGFAAVIEHEHPAARFTLCCCRRPQ